MGNGLTGRVMRMAASQLDRAADDVAGRQVKRTIWSGVLTGIGLAAFLDETVFHQLLHWHHFYDRSTLAVGLLSDGLFHAGGFIAIVAALFLMADTLRRRGFVPKRWWGRCCWAREGSSSTTARSSTSCSASIRSVTTSRSGLTT
jgi:Predicted membrane protein (DUF2243)